MQADNFESRLYRFSLKTIFDMITKGCSDMSDIKGRSVVCSLFLAAVLFSLLLMPAHCSESSVGQRLILNVYLDSSGKALVTGYAENVSGLAFLNNSQFRFENDSHQLYALTAGLTTKVGDIWTLSFNANGSFDDYRATFYLPSETSLGQINASQGLGYLLSASNESLVADVQGWDVSDPQISIQYRQLLDANSKSQLPLPPAYPGESAALIMFIIAAALLIAGFGFAVFLQRKRHGATKDGATKGPSGALDAKGNGSEIGKDEQAVQKDSGPSEIRTIPATASSSFQSDSSSEDDGVLISQDELPPASVDETESNSDMHSESSPPSQPSPSSQRSSISQETIQLNEQPTAQTADVSAILSKPTSVAESSKVLGASNADGGHQQEPVKNGIAVSSEMQAVIETLTARERAVMSTLIAHGGRMTQAEIRYETGTPKSSLTGILISLERRKLVIKKEWGRTNIIELSEWFLSKKERS
jgi:hypothetical protein